MNSNRSSNWACEACTYLNYSSVDSCFICDGPKPATYIHRGDLVGENSSGHCSVAETDEGYRFDGSIPSSAGPSIELSNISMGIMLGAAGGAGLALLRGRSVTSGALVGAGYGALGGLLINETNRMNLDDSNGFATTPVTENITGAIQNSGTSFLSYTTHYDFGDQIASLSDDFESPIFFSDFDDIPVMVRETNTEDIDMSYENLIARFGTGNEQTPASENFINSLPSSRFSESRKHQNGDKTDNDKLDAKNSCSICIEEYQVGEEISSLPCLHMFHCHCINEWLRHCNTCPICKFSF